MSTAEHLLTYRGEIEAVAGHGRYVRFVTRHREGIPLPIYQLDLESSELTELMLPGPAVSILNEDETSWVGGTAGSLFVVDWKSKKVSTAKVTLEDPIEHMALLQGDRLAALAGKTCHILNRSGTATSFQTFELDDRGTSIAADPSGPELVKAGRA